MKTRFLCALCVFLVKAYRHIPCCYRESGRYWFLAAHVL
jgi:hypothetical protein